MRAHRGAEQGVNRRTVSLKGEETLRFSPVARKNRILRRHSPGRTRSLLPRARARNRYSRPSTRGEGGPLLKNPGSLSASKYPPLRPVGDVPHALPRFQVRPSLKPPRATRRCFRGGSPRAVSTRASVDRRAANAPRATTGSPAHGRETPPQGLIDRAKINNSFSVA